MADKKLTVGDVELTLKPVTIDPPYQDRQVFQDKDSGDYLVLDGDEVSDRYQAGSPEHVRFQARVV